MNMSLFEKGGMVCTSDMEKHLVKENRALDMELMEAYEKIRSLENRLNFLQSFRWVGIDPILDNK
jgi:hypothetical protein